jgi:hypothetical protein
VVVCLDAATLQVLGDMEGSLFQKEKGFSHALMEHSGDEVWIRGPKYMAVANDNSEPSNMSAQRTAHADMGAFYDNGFPAPVVALLLGNNHIAGPRALDSCSDGVASPREDVVPFVTDQGVYYHDVLLPPENVVPAAEALRALGSPTYAVQVSWACAVS